MDDTDHGADAAADDTAHGASGLAHGAADAVHGAAHDATAKAKGNPLAVGLVAFGLYIVLREGLSKASENRPVLESRSRPETGLMPRISLMLRRRGDRSEG